MNEDNYTNAVYPTVIESPMQDPNDQPIIKRGF